MTHSPHSGNTHLETRSQDKLGPEASLGLEAEEAEAVNKERDCVGDRRADGRAEVRMPSEL